MKPLAHLDQLNLDADTKQQVAGIVQTLLDQAQQAQQEIRAQELKIQALTMELAHLRRIRFGKKNESLSSIQPSLFEESVLADIAAVHAEIEQIDTTAKTATNRSTRSRAGRQPLPDHLPRIEHRHEPASCQCGQCGKALVKIGEDVTEQLDVEPARFFVHRHIRPQYACKTCETVTAEPVPPAVIDGGMAAPGLLAWVISNKYLNHLPLYRLEQIAAREQVTLSRSTLAEWVGRTGVALQPLADRLKWHLLQGNTLHADESPVAQQEPGNGKTRKAYLWAYRSNDLDPGPRIVVFDYQTSRSGRHAQNFLQNWQGHLQVDDYGGYKALFSRTASPCIELACWAHARRRFFDLHQANDSPMAFEALQRIGELYAVEAEARQLDCVVARQQLRKQKSLPILDALHDWLMQTRLQTANGGASAKALDYTLKRWPSLVRYAHTGNLPIDNNPVENSIRPIAVGKKNWLFTGSERAGQRAAAIQTLLGTAQLNGLDPAAWLKDILTKLPTWPNSRIDELLPLTPEFIEALKQEKL
ncbi:IS66 family transposase [Nitrosomonas marina]|uniref:Transposase n=1 Tax=Nitrosomonas marina TaxID=917 RepID=A0A1H8J7T1_9PROT|nr:IS66 family transposase [Nitrosomonas marina]SEN76834.1 Transposase [Nitrosomonas marina]